MARSGKGDSKLEKVKMTLKMRRNKLRKILRFFLRYN